MFLRNSNDYFDVDFLFQRGDLQEDIDKETKERLDNMAKLVAANKGKVIDDLLRRVVFDIKPELHRNLRLDTLNF